MPATNIFSTILSRTHAAVAVLAAEGRVPAGLDLSRIVVEPPRDPAHGDMATNAAMVLAKDARMKPRELAEAIAAELGKDGVVATVEVVLSQCHAQTAGHHVARLHHCGNGSTRV